ncbi:MAG: flagellar hook-length control protein FliK [Aromatoleum sp.]|uniref:flagellar hook-length control protein FliK n=1 Tax=Aromatoleum sp. TaxID=2307007 RepID=UPI002893957C|nr:flagellar hook-length control protein FliK [Aromatoleum sp.]MDT3671898.1 flagellar hook-length control protein FliK [Aromatoleum sp.]
MREAGAGVVDSRAASAPLFADLLRDIAANAPLAGIPAEAAPPTDATEPTRADEASVAALGSGDTMLARPAVVEGVGADRMSFAMASARGGAAMNAPAATLRQLPPAVTEVAGPVVTQTEKTTHDAARLAALQPAALERPAASQPAALDRPAMGEPAVPRGERGVASAAVEPAFALALPSDHVSAREAAPLKLPNGPATQWREPLQQALGERLQVEIGRGGERAVIRLDPPMMGRVEIVIRHDGGSLHVQLTATHGEVLRQLQGIGETLRQDLVQRNFGDVSVAVFDATHDGGGRSRRDRGDDPEREPGRALSDDAPGVFAFNRDEE